MPLVLNSSSISGLAAVGGLSSPQTGSVLQVVSANTRTYSTTSTTGSWIDSGISASITPTSSSSRILVIAAPSVLIDKVSSFDNLAFLIVDRSGTKLAASFTNLRAYDRGGSGNQLQTKPSVSFVDSPSTTSSITYKIYSWLPSSGAITVSFNSTEGASPSVDGLTECASTLTLMEIAG
jgi:hypothetical protein